ncbi:hypothetical protein EDD18DRAFT_1464980, partial [Armillaria luteobubalina]
MFLEVRDNHSLVEHYLSSSNIKEPQIAKILQTYNQSSSIYFLHSSPCVSQLLLSFLSRSSRSLPSPLPSRLGTAMSTTKAMTVEAKITPTETKARMTVVATALGLLCLSTRMTSRDGTRASTLHTSTRKSPRSTLRSSVRASARRTQDDKCNSCQAYSHDEKDEKFICDLFVEIIDVDTWEQDCDEGNDDKDGKDGKQVRKLNPVNFVRVVTMD